MLPYLFLIIGLVLLVKGADLFVEGSSSIAKILRVPSIIIGLTIVAFGTSAPEAAVSVTASIQGQNEIAVGNVIGSNMFNLLVVVGMCAVIRRVRVKRSMIAKEFPFAILSCLILIMMALDTPVSYTHLDVYKRQAPALCRLGRACGFCRLCNSGPRYMGAHRRECHPQCQRLRFSLRCRAQFGGW